MVDGGWHSQGHTSRQGWGLTPGLSSLNGQVSSLNGQVNLGLFSWSTAFLQRLGGLKKLLEECNAAGKVQEECVACTVAPQA